MRKLLIIPIILIAFYSCGQKQKTETEYPLQVGDIYSDAEVDDPTFKLCDETRVLQYYNLNGMQYRGEKPALNEPFFKRGSTLGKPSDTGYVTIRFIINCEGKTGRFRLTGMDQNYQEKEFSNSLTTQLLNLTKHLDGWEPAVYNGKKYDYYQYLTFKVEGGNLLEILP